MGLEGLSLYRRVPRDLQSSTNLGGFLSIVAVASMVCLFVAHVRDFAKVTIETDVEIDYHDDENIRVEFNLTMHNMPCNYLSIDVRDSAGGMLDNITTGIHLFRKNFPGAQGKKAPYQRHLINPLQHSKPFLHDPRVIEEAQKGEIGLIPLTHKNFDQLRSKSVWMFVRFYADWCPHSEASDVDWQLLMAANKQKPPREGIVIHHISCTESIENAKLCLEQRVRAFPTFRVYFTPEGHKGDRGGAQLDYVGPRDFPHLGRFVYIFGTTEHSDTWKELVTPVATWEESCEVAGVVMVSRVPGQITIKPSSHEHSFNPSAANVSHTVHSMRFAPPLPGDKHAYELERLTYALHPVVELASEASYLLGSPDSDAILESVDDKGRKRRPKPRGAMVDYYKDPHHDPRMSKAAQQAAIDEQLKQVNFTGNMSDPVVREKVRESFVMGLKLKKVQALVQKLKALPADDHEARAQLELEIDMLDGRRLLAMAAYRANSTRFREMHPEMFKDHGEEDLKERAGASARRLLFGEDKETEVQHGESGKKKGDQFPMGKWADMMPDQSKAYFSELRRRKAELEQATAEELKEKDTTTVRKRRHALNSLFKQEPKLLGHYDHLAKSDFTTQFRRSTIEHHLKVVPISYEDLHGETVYFYEYTVANREAQREDVPAASFSYEVSPVRLAARQSKENFVTFVTQLCAVIGGVFTVMGILDSTLHAGSRVVTQKLGLGKLS